MVARAGGRSSPACGVCVAVRVFFFVAPYCFAAQWTGVSFASVAGCVFALASSCSPQGHQAGKTKFEGGGGGARRARETRGSSTPVYSPSLHSLDLPTNREESKHRFFFFFWILRPSACCATHDVFLQLCAGAQISRGSSRCPGVDPPGCLRLEAVFGPSLLAPDVMLSGFAVLVWQRRGCRSDPQ